MSYIQGKQCQRCCVTWHASSVAQRLTVYVYKDGRQSSVATHECADLERCVAYQGLFVAQHLDSCHGERCECRTCMYLKAHGKADLELLKVVM